jgi:alpha-N-arabinofuranosidase
MFSNHHGDQVLGVTESNFPTWSWQPPPPRAPRVQPGQPAPPPAPPAAPPPPRDVPALFSDVTRDSKTGKIFVKVVNHNGAPQPVTISVAGVKSVAPTGTAVVMAASSPDDTNTLMEPTKVAPVTQKVSGLGTRFTRSFPAYSITVLEMTAK